MGSLRTVVIRFYSGTTTWGQCFFDYPFISPLAYRRGNSILAALRFGVSKQGQCVPPHWHEQEERCWCSDICRNRRLIILTQLLLHLCTIGASHGGRAVPLQKTGVFFRVTVNMIARPALFNSHYPEETGELCRIKLSDCADSVNGGAEGLARMKAARALSSGKGENFSLPSKQEAFGVFSFPFF